ncbi:polysaccharide deacetylase family protein [Ferribacterium limneticum]|uniref:polysaccharide deacetylase family protein n=1 Tax=Ferribacterium limneticum TaxID=76259 RepID=UPI001CF8C64A|nr:polysaccharide deacetylase family protein [Ferribacterium limneticum]UCV22946.1 polysaccharide deacetylase family protein [Ferribacterium limneticum]
MPTPWKPTLAIKATLAVHAAAAAGCVLAPAIWPWAVGALVINHAIITTAGLLPRTTLLGPNLNHLPDDAVARREVAITIDDGPDPEVTPRVLDLLDAANAKATFFCIGWRARENPALCREIVARGHRVENHGDSHSKAFAFFGPGRMKADIAAAQATFAEITGQAPRYFRATAGLRNPFLDAVLHNLGLKLASWTRRPYDTRCSDPETVFRRLSRDLGPGDILLLHDGHAARTADGQPVILAVLPRLITALRQHSLNPVTLPDFTS